MKYYHEEAIKNAVRSFELYRLELIDYTKSKPEPRYVKFSNDGNLRFYKVFYRIFIKLRNNEYYELSETIIEKYFNEILSS